MKIFSKLTDDSKRIKTERHGLLKWIFPDVLFPRFELPERRALSA